MNKHMEKKKNKSESVLRSVKRLGIPLLVVLESYIEEDQSLKESRIKWSGS